jgi:solute carrier family 25 carnitine/acylcarnitine transporter 20/29
LLPPACLYPACACATDIIKSKLQVDSYSKPQFKGIMDCGRQIVADQGIKGLYRGFAPALARSFPANAVCFAVYEAVKAQLTAVFSPDAAAV